MLGQARIGVRVASLVSWLRTCLRLPGELIQTYLQTLHGLALSVGAIVTLQQRVSAASAPAVQRLKTALRHSGVVQADETGWREDGHNGYVWSFSTPSGLRYYEYERSRAGAVAQWVLEATFGGIW